MSHRLAGVAELADARDSKARPYRDSAGKSDRVRLFPSPVTSGYPLSRQNHYRTTTASSVASWRCKPEHF